MSDIGEWRGRGGAVDRLRVPSATGFGPSGDSQAHGQDRVVIQDILSRVRPLRALLLVVFDSTAWILSFTALAWLQVHVHDSPPEHIYRSFLVGCASAGAFLLARRHAPPAPGPVRDRELREHVPGRHGCRCGRRSLTLVVGLAVHLRIESRCCSSPAPLGAVIADDLGPRHLPHDPGPRVRLRHPRGTEPTLVIGAGEGGRQLIHSMCNAPAPSGARSAWSTTTRAKRHRRIRGVPMMGTTRDLAESRDQTGADAPRSSRSRAPAPRLIRQISRRGVAVWARREGAAGPRELLQPSRAAISDIRDIDVTDLLGRHAIDTDLRSIASYLTGKRVLVTGAGGSIGSELCRQISRFEPAELIMLDRDESALHAVQLSPHGPGAARLDDDVVLGDIRDAAVRAPSCSRPRRPQVVFHAAALKHLPDAGAVPRRGDQDQRLGHADRARGRRGRPASSGSSTSRPTRPPTRAACSATPSGSPRA